MALPKYNRKQRAGGVANYSTTLRLGEKQMMGCHVDFSGSTFDSEAVSCNQLPKKDEKERKENKNKEEKNTHQPKHF